MASELLIRAHLDALLTPREREVIHLAASGMTNSETAKRLNLSVHGVKFHLASIYRKLGVANRTEAAVAYLRAYGLPQDPTSH